MTPLDQEFLKSEGGPPGDCVRACVASILELPLQAVPHFVALHDSNWEAGMEDWLKTIGIDVVRLEGHHDFEFPVMFTGASPREGRHAVVGVHGEIIHDPHPSRDGLKGPLAVRTYIFVPHDIDYYGYIRARERLNRITVLS